ncbi:glycosyltransferase family 2 protein [Geotalea sp. SG265]|uniref:glycosyltransferase family 2 protein n=1 Tax=Geotalea sp. SG265 TaxID=2922867 RepID=UPI001FAFD79D|nr:glycosyltransferase family 2 protein [Geotalea sp. SG265]
MLKIFVITVVFNGAADIEKTIRSVINMSGDIDYIVIDGGSTDGTVDIIKKYQDRMICWISEKDNGIYDAMNKGWAIAPDDSYVLFLGAGDTLLSLPQEPNLSNADVIYGRVRIGSERICSSTIDFKLRFCNTLHHQALLVRKAISPQPPFDTDFRIYADFDFNQRLYLKGARFAFSETFWATALPGGVSDRVNYTEYYKVVRKNFGIFAALQVFILEPSLRIYKFFQKRVFNR